METNSGEGKGLALILKNILKMFAEVFDCEFKRGVDEIAEAIVRELIKRG